MGTEEDKVKEFAIKNAGKRARGTKDALVLVGRITGYMGILLLIENENAAFVPGSERKVAPFVSSAGGTILVSGKRKASISFPFSNVWLTDENATTTTPAEIKKAPEEKQDRPVSTTCHTECVYGFCHREYVSEPVRVRSK